ncbi:hypothetical protein [Bacteroides sp. f07]|uniref:hypothetical protein n=1 Tax=Bacteroides sp. f07 TaxID=3132704 RepID=UPI0036F2BF5B
MMKLLSQTIIVAFLAGAGVFGVLRAQDSPASLQVQRDLLLNPLLMKQSEQLLRFVKKCRIWVR